MVDDIDLIRKAQRGDEESLTKVIKKSKPLVRFFAKRYIHHGLDFEDLEQEGYIGIWKALKDFNPAVSSFDNYAGWCVRSRMLLEIKRASKLKRDQIHLVENSYILKEYINPDIDIIVQKCLNSIDERSRIIIQHRYGINCEPKLQRELEQELGISRQRISKIEEVAFKKMRKLVNGGKDEHVSF